METKTLIGKNILYRTMNGTGYGKVVSLIDNDNVAVRIKDVWEYANVNVNDIIKVYG